MQENTSLSNPNPYGVPKTEEQRKETHKAVYGTPELPPRGTGQNPGNPVEPSRIDVERYFETGQVTLADTAKKYEIVKLRGGQAAVIKALVGNAGNVYEGRKDVTTSNGFELSPGESVRIRYEPGKEITERITLYCVCATAGDKICYQIVP